jgi:hypothetical protein
MFMRLRWKRSFNGSVSTQKKNVVAVRGLIASVVVP